MFEGLTLPWLGAATEPALVALVALAGVLFVVTLAFSAYAVVLRLGNERREARRSALRERWQAALLEAIADPTEASALHALVEPEHRLHFVGFVLEFARRMRGEEVAVLRAFAAPYLGLVAERARSDRMEIRARAVQTLGTLGLPELEATVIAALDDPSPLVAMVAARALAKAGEPRYAAPVLAHVERFSGWNRRYLASMLAAMGPPVARGLREGLADPSARPWKRSVMAEALALQGDFAAGDVAAEVVATSADTELRVASLGLLAEVGRPDHVPVVRGAVASQEIVVRTQALKALGRLGGEEDLPALVAALDDDFAWAALYAARGVREAGGRHLLLEAATLPNRRGRLAAQVLAEETAW